MYDSQMIIINFGCVYKCNDNGSDENVNEREYVFAEVVIVRRLDNSIQIAFQWIKFTPTHTSFSRLNGEKNFYLKFSLELRRRKITVLPFTITYHTQSLQITES